MAGNFEFIFDFSSKITTEQGQKKKEHCGTKTSTIYHRKNF